MLICRLLILSLTNTNNFKDSLSLINKIFPEIVVLYGHSHDLFIQTVFDKILHFSELGKLNEGLVYINQILKNIKLMKKQLFIFYGFNRTKYCF